MDHRHPTPHDVEESVHEPIKMRSGKCSNTSCSDNNTAALTSMSRGNRRGGSSNTGTHCGNNDTGNSPCLAVWDNMDSPDVEHSRQHFTCAW